MALQKRRIPRLNAAIDWIALDDEPAETDIRTVTMLISVVLVADLWQRQPEEIARKVVARRQTLSAPTSLRRP